MSIRYKNIVYSLLLFLAMFLVWKYRQANQVAPMISFSGKTMGPIAYSVKYFDAEKRNLQTQVDSILKDFNQSLSTYIEDSEISTFNRHATFTFDLPYFFKALDVSNEVYKLTEGAFDPSMGPLINTWGFGYTDGVDKDSAVIDSLMSIVGMEKINFDKDSVWKTDLRAALDFSASAKGYGVDVVLEYLQSRGLENIFVEIGGEVRASGMNLESDQPWKVGILNPNSDELNQFTIAIASLKNKAMATSGNYFNYHIIDGVKYSHTISPFTGFPIQHALLSATIFADDCMRADALATAFMVLGQEKTIEFLQNHEQYDAFLIFSDKQGNLSTYSTSGIAPFIKTVN